MTKKGVARLVAALWGKRFERAARCGRPRERRAAPARRRGGPRPPPPRGWYLPAVARGEADCDCFDIIAGLVLQDGPEVEVLTGLALHGGLPDAWPEDGMTTGRGHTALQARWRAEGPPPYAHIRS